MNAMVISKCKQAGTNINYIEQQSQLTSWPSIYVTLNDWNTLIKRLLNNEAEVPKGTTHVSEGITIFTHVMATASAEIQEYTKGDI